MTSKVLATSKKGTHRNSVSLATALETSTLLHSNRLLDNKLHL
jgi:hypothetical protein